MVRPPSEPPAQKPVQTDAERQLAAAAQRIGLNPVAQPMEDRVWVFPDQPFDKQPTISEAKNLYAQLNKQQLGLVARKMNEYYGKGNWSLSGGAGKAGVRGFLEEAADISAQEARAGKKVFLFNAFDRIVEAYSQLGLNEDGTRSGGAVQQQITKSINLTDPGTAETLIDQALQQYLGRRASNDEVLEFRKALRKAERGSPREADIEGDTQITSGGFNPATFAQQYAEGMEGAAEYQAVTTFLDSFINSISARVDIV